jgi:hypothetical protein
MIWRRRRRGFLSLTDAQKKRISDIATGKSVNSKIAVEDQIAALRKQVIALSTAAKVPLVQELITLEAVVDEEKAKKTGKAKS